MNVIRRLLLVACAAFVAGCGGGSDGVEASSPLRAPAGAFAAITPESRANQLFDFAERVRPQFFPEHQTNRTDQSPFLYRHYSNGVNLGVVVTQNPFFPLDGVYTLGGVMGGLTYQGQLTDFVVPTDPNPAPNPGTTTKNLVVSINVAGVGGFGPFALGPTALPPTQDVFCAAATPSNSVFTQAFAQAGLSGTATINSCSFSGSTGTVGALVTVNGAGTFQMTLTFSYQ